MKLSYWLEFILIKLFEYFFSIFPSRVVEWMGFKLGTFIWIFFPYRLNIAFNNLSIAFPDKSREEKLRILHSTYKYYGYMIATYFIANRKYMRKKILNTDTNAEELFNKELLNKKGIILSGLHFGLWETYINYLNIKQFKFSGLYKPMKNKLTDKYFINHRLKFGDNLRHINIKDNNNYEKELKENRILAIAVDQNAHKKGTKVFFLGKEASIPKGVAVFYIRTNSPIYLGAYIMKNLKYHLIIKKINVPEYSEINEKSINSIMSKVLKEYEEIVKTYPEQYLWFHKLWGKPKSKIKRTMREIFKY
ncbi:MAG: hypothetical protein U9R41_01590 [Candidatus Marinimicrobia bacterium]|nr:hypothetical protein [Candidatus Neomarinimicrobiota bacterium]